MTDFDQIRALWTAQPVEPFTLSVDQLRKRAGKFQVFGVPKAWEPLGE